MLVVSAVGRGVVAVVCLIAAVAAAAVIVFGVPVQGAQSPAPTFNKDVAKIVFDNCASCHRRGDVAPMSLMSYSEVRPWARAIKQRVEAREMPPWPADPSVGRFRNAHALTDAQRALLIAWVDGGAAEGEGSPPRPPRFVDGWTSEMDRPPDQVIEAPFGANLPPSGTIPEFKVWSRFEGRDQFLEAIELRPLNRAVMHHASVFRARMPPGVGIGSGELWPGGPVLNGVPQTRGGRPILESSVLSLQPLIFYVPSGGFLRLPRRVAKRIQANDFLQWTFHLVTTGKAEPAGARIGLWFTRTDPEHEVFTLKVTETVIVDEKEIEQDALGPKFPNIAPNDADYTVTGLLKVTEPITLYALWPHMHYRGRDMTFVLVDKNGREQTLLSVPKYSFAWQFTYQLASPMRISAGSTIKAIAHYDNSSRNRENPDPNQEVIWGPQATNEMFDPYIEVAYDRRTLQSPECAGAGLRPSEPSDQPGGGLSAPRCR